MKKTIDNISISLKIGVLLFLLFGVCQNGLAQGPNAPEASGFEPVDATDMVNLVTGDLSYVLPVLNVPSPEGGYPLSLAYHAGIALDQEASWVGLGWSLSPGALNREISGVPDDWKDGLKSKISRDIGGEQTINTASIGVGWGNDESNSIGATVNWSANRAFGGETTYSYAIGVAAEIGGNSYKLNYASNGNFSVNYNNYSYNTGSGFGIQLAGYGHEDESGNRIQANISLTQKNGLGISLSSNTGFSISTVGDSSSGTNTSGNLISIVNSGKFSANATIGPVRLSFSRQKIRYWSFDEKTYGNTGSLYAGDLDGVLDQKILPYIHSFDMAESLYKVNNPDLEAAKNNPTYISYDSYNASSQGLSASLKPMSFDNGYLHNNLRIYNSDVNLYGLDLHLQGLFYYGSDFSKSVGSSNASDRINFFIENEYSSSYINTPGAWNHPNQFDDIIGFSDNVNIGQSLSSTGYNASNNHLKKSTFIETYTNSEIIANPTLLPIVNVDRSHFPDDGIGGFKIVSADGKTYYYTIPVYQKEKFSRIALREDDIDNKYTEDQSLSHYATHWLLTGITGPDYIDNNNNNKIDKGDYGYWVDFNYGKWSDGFSWRVPAVGYNYGENTKSYSWGIKDVYYLNTIKTRTHTAFFIKEQRLDNKAITEQVGTSRTNLLIRNATYHSFQLGIPIYIGTDGNRYYPGAYSALSSVSVDNPHNGTITAEITNGFYARSFNHKSLRLKEVHLIDNDKVPDALASFNALNQTNNGILAADFLFKERVEMEASNGGEYVDTGFVPYLNTTYKGEFWNNVITVENINALAPNVKNLSTKIISFDYDHSLAGNTPNSTAGKNTLLAVNVLGRGGIDYMPPFSFDYNNIHDYDLSNKDSWGFNKMSPQDWSLKEIYTPSGGKINIDYESDDYYVEAALDNVVFEHNLEVRFKGTNAGAKYVEFRNDTDNESDQNIDFREYFKIGQFEKVDVQYWNNPNGPHDHRIADVATRGQVVSVGVNFLKIRIPNNQSHTSVRRGDTCHEEDWVRYSRYEEVVGRTNGWKKEEADDLCGDPGEENEKTKIRLYARARGFNKIKGGGLRVREIVTSADGEEYPTYYLYNEPTSNSDPDHSNYTSSGVTSYAPSRFFKEIPYASFVPAPSVFYKNVQVVRLDMRDTYEFKVLEPFSIDASNDYRMGEYLKVDVGNENISNVPAGPIDIKLNKQHFEIKDNLNNLGALINKKTFNNENMLLSSVRNTYLEENEIDFGVVEENFSTIEQIWGHDGSSGSFTRAINLGNTSKITKPAVLSGNISTEGNITKVSVVDQYDINTGQPIESTTISSLGNTFKDKIVPAYTIVSYNPTMGHGMGSKVDNPTNKNMLAQEAASFTYLIDGTGQEKVLNANISTWSNDWEYRDNTGVPNSPSDLSQKIWRRQGSYIWKGSLDQDGAYVNYTGDYDGFNWGINATQPKQWQMTGKTALYDHYSMSLENMDINGNHASTKMGDDHTKIFSVANAAYTEHYFSGAEEGVNGPVGGEVHIWNPSQDKIHTGSYSEKAGSGSRNFKVAPVPMKDGPQKYRLSVWADKENVTKARVNTGNGVIPFNGERITAGDWVQLNHYFDISNEGNNEIYVTASSGTVYYDDFRVHPIQASLTSYVYNEWDELTHIIGANNMATRYEYDSTGRLRGTYTEVADTDSIIGGFKQVEAYDQNYKRSISSGDQDDSDTPPVPISGTISAYTMGCGGNASHQLDETDKGVYGQVNVSGGSGNYNYEWQWSLNGSNNWTTYTTSGNSMLLSYNPDLSTLCGGPGNNGSAQEIQLRCIVSDASDSSFADAILTSGPEYLSCTTCEGGGNQE